MDVIEAQNEYALRSSVKQLKGAVQERIKALRAGILYEIAHIESAWMTRSTFRLRAIRRSWVKRTRAGKKRWRRFLEIPRTERL